MDQWYFAGVVTLDLSLGSLLMSQVVQVSDTMMAEQYEGVTLFLGH